MFFVFFLEKETFQKKKKEWSLPAPGCNERLLLALWPETVAHFTANLSSQHLQASGFFFFFFLEKETFF